MKIKTMLAATLASLGLMSTAGAATTSILSSMSCGTTQTCQNIPNSTGLNIVYLSFSNTYKRVNLNIDGNLYDSGLYAVPSLATGLSFTDVPVYDGSGHVVYVTAKFTVTYTKTVSGRGQTSVPHYTLASGSITQ